jgi:hypothetical protein
MPKTKRGSKDGSARAERKLAAPVFAQPTPTEDPTTYRVPHPSDGVAYKEIDELNAEHKIFPLSFPAPRGDTEPVLTLAEVLGGVDGAPDLVVKNASDTVQEIEKAGQIVFHARGDCGNAKSPGHEYDVIDKMIGDFEESNQEEVPQLQLLLGDVVYSFGEAQYYYDQFYEPNRDYPAPILAVAGNHDGMISPVAGGKSLEAYLRNFCAEDFVVTKDAGGLSRTAQIQPGVYFTFEAPFLRLLVLYSNTLEDPGVIADGVIPGSKIGKRQLDFIAAALKRAKRDGFKGAILMANHHPPYTYAKHGWSTGMLAQIDKVCHDVGVWPHAFLSGHAHNYQRFTRSRSKDGTQIPYVVCGNGAHSPLQRLSKSAGHTMRVPQIVQKKTDKDDLVVFESYDDQNYGYLRLIIDAKQLRIEYHPASDGRTTKSPDDAVTVDLATRKLVHYTANDLGHPIERDKVHRARLALQPESRRRRGK